MHNGKSVNEMNLSFGLLKFASNIVNAEKIMSPLHNM